MACWWRLVLQLLPISSAVNIFRLSNTFSPHPLLPTTTPLPMMLRSHLQNVQSGISGQLDPMSRHLLACEAWLLVPLHTSQSRYVSISWTRHILLTPCWQLRFALSNANTWRIVDGEFSHEVFYAACIDYFEDVPGPVARARVDALLAWWNRFVIWLKCPPCFSLTHQRIRKVFGREGGAPQPVQVRHGNASVSTLAAQRKARESL